MTETLEVWLPVTGYEEFYEVSSLGRVRRIKKRGKWPALGIMRLTSDMDGYSAICLRDSNGFRTKLKVHKLVLTAFVGPRPKGKQCRHLDGDRTNARLDNLKWGTHEENRLDMVRHGTDGKGVRNGRAVLTENEVLEIRENRNNKTQRELAEEYEVSRSTIQRVVYRWQWTHLE